MTQSQDHWYIIGRFVTATDSGAADSGAAAEQATGGTGQATSGCGCFPGTTGVATPHGLVAIASLRVGDLVLAENPATGKIDTEPVQAVIDNGIKPLMQVQLSDGSSLSVTTNHPFYVDSGPGLSTPQWVQAGDLRVGDRLRTEEGRDVAVTALHYDTGYAHVYTLTVASDHDFFVGSADILVHNQDEESCPVGAANAAQESIGQQVYGPYYNQAEQLHAQDPAFFADPDAPGTHVVGGSALKAARAEYQNMVASGSLPAGHHVQALALGGTNVSANIVATGESTIPVARLRGIDMSFYRRYGSGAKSFKIYQLESGVYVFGLNPRHTLATVFQNAVFRWQRLFVLR
jgi:hypothetical protein